MQQIDSISEVFKFLIEEDTAISDCSIVLYTLFFIVSDFKCSHNRSAGFNSGEYGGN